MKVKDFLEYLYDYWLVRIWISDDSTIVSMKMSDGLHLCNDDFERTDSIVSDEIMFREIEGISSSYINVIGGGNVINIFLKGGQS